MIALFPRLKSAVGRFIAATLALAISGCAVPPVAPPVDKAPPNARTTDADAIALFRSWDVDKNFIVTGEEFPYSLQLYGELTKETDGTLRADHFVVLYPQYLRKTEETMRKPQGWFQLYDKDGNGNFDSSELARLPEGKALVERFDLNHDGILTLQEVEILSQRPQRWRSMKLSFDLIREFNVWDRDKNGALDARELGRESYLIEMLDRNGDRALQLEELQVVQKLQSDGPEALDRYALSLRFGRLDKNRDGRLSMEELGRHRRVAKWLDRDGDGQIVLEEFLKLHEANKNLLRPVRLAEPTSAGKQPIADK